jgi:TRAP-type C4-dicarboxylate transport system permease large subunit
MGNRDACLILGEFIPYLTPPESAAVAVVYGVIVGKFLYKIGIQSFGENSCDSSAEQRYHVSWLPPAPSLVLTSQNS